MNSVMRGKFTHLIVEKFKTETDGKADNFIPWLRELKNGKSVVPPPDNSVPKLDISVLKKWLASYENKGGHNKSLYDLMHI